MELKVGDKVKLIKDIEISYNGFANGGFLIPKYTILYYKCKSINPRGSILYSGEYGEISIPDCYFIMLEQIEKLEVERDDKVTLINPFKEQKMINIFSKEDYKDNYIQVNYNNKPIIYVSPILLQGRAFKDIKDLNDNCLNKYGYNIIEEIDWSKVERGTRLYLLDSLDKQECLAFGTFYTFEEFRDGKVVANRVLVVEYKQVGVKEFDVNDVYVRE